MECVLISLFKSINTSMYDGNNSLYVNILFNILNMLALYHNPDNVKKFNMHGIRGI